MAILCFVILALAAVTGVTIATTEGEAGAASLSTPNSQISSTEVIARAQYWMTAGHTPPCGYTDYNSSSCNTRDPQGVGYRSDCSGFVSMALHLSAPGLDTQDMANSSMFTQITKDALQVGDIMDHPPAGPSGHVVLFNGWTSSTHTSYDAYEFGGGSQPAHHVIPYPYFSWDPNASQYLPFHYKGLVSASPSTVVYAAAANTGVLRVNGHPVDASVPLVAAGTSPSIAAVGSSYLVAYQAAATHHLIVVNSALQATDTNYGMADKTSPSITGLANGKYEIAFQANTGDLWTVPDHGNSGDGMMAGTSPSITAVGSGYTVAFQANTGDLWEFPSTTNSGVSMRSGMKAGTSPSITTVAGQVEVAMQANTGNLYFVGAAKTGVVANGMMAGTSPSIAAVGSGFAVAFQANTGVLWEYASASGGAVARTLGMKTGTSPSIAAAPNLPGGVEMAVQANTTDLWMWNGGRITLGMQPNSNPSIAVI